MSGLKDLFSWPYGAGKYAGSVQHGTVGKTSPRVSALPVEPQPLQTSSFSSLLPLPPLLPNRLSLLPSPPIPALQHHQDVQEVCCSCQLLFPFPPGAFSRSLPLGPFLFFSPFFLCSPIVPGYADHVFFNKHSGLARSLGRAAFARPSLARRSLVPSLGARFASSSTAGVGKIHQVIGAVVDGAFF